MSVVIENEIVCNITIKDGAGEVSSATLSVRKDPTNINTLSQLYSKQDNNKPFILGVSKLGDKGYCYKNNAFKGISSVGSGSGVTMTLEFSQLIDHFTIYFEDKVPTIPTSITINGTTYQNDDAKFSYAQDTEATSFTLEFGQMRPVNGVEPPLIIVGIESAIKMVFDKRNGLKNARLGRTYTKEQGKPAYGIYSNDGRLEILDVDSELDDLAEINALKNVREVSVSMGKETKSNISKYQSGIWSANGKNYTVSMNDWALKLQSIQLDAVNYARNTNLYNIYDNLVEELQEKFNIDFAFSMFDDTADYLESIQIAEYSLPQQSAWDRLQYICDCGQCYMYCDETAIVMLCHRQS